MSTTHPGPAGTTAAWRGLVDDAAMFPPGDLPLAEAVPAHRGHRESWYADLVGPLVVRDEDLPRVVDAAGPQRPGALAVLVTGGAGGIAGPLQLCTRRGLAVAAVEIALRDLDDLPGNTRRVLAALDAAHDAGDLADDVRVHVEIPPVTPGAGPGHGWLAAADVAAEAELALKFRTGSPDADLVPGTDAVARWIDAALERELPFKCTAGLHRAVRHRTGPDATPARTWQHGFLNVLLATRMAFDSEPVEEVAGVLAETDADRLRGLVEEYGEDALARTRRWFTSFGSCSIDEPVADLVDLGLLVRSGT